LKVLKECHKKKGGKEGDRHVRKLKGLFILWPIEYKKKSGF